MRIDNTHFLSNYFPGIYVDYGIVWGGNAIVEGRDNAIYGWEGNEVYLWNSKFCGNNWDVNMFQNSGNHVRFASTTFSRGPAGETKNGLFYPEITWDSWNVSSCGFAKASASVSGGISEETKPSVPNNDPAREAYTKVVEKYRAIYESLQTENEKIDFKQHSSEFSDVMADFQNIVDTYPENRVCVSALSHIIGFLCKQE
ncbi:MAG TPA: hypothetical protein DCQ28_10480, partial [Bacteroidetes bacterium]|nr:hypothetical protein [Bacteroidota bacterium]